MGEYFKYPRRPQAKSKEEVVACIKRPYDNAICKMFLRTRPPGRIAHRYILVMALIALPPSLLYASLALITPYQIPYSFDIISTLALFLACISVTTFIFVQTGFENYTKWRLLWRHREDIYLTHLLPHELGEGVAAHTRLIYNKMVPWVAVASALAFSIGGVVFSFFFFLSPLQVIAFYAAITGSGILLSLRFRTSFHALWIPGPPKTLIATRVDNPLDRTDFTVYSETLVNIVLWLASLIFAIFLTIVLWTIMVDDFGRPFFPPALFCFALGFIWAEVVSDSREERVLFIYGRLALAIAPFRPWERANLSQRFHRGESRDPRLEIKA